MMDKFFFAAQQVTSGLHSNYGFCHLIIIIFIVCSADFTRFIDYILLQQSTNYKIIIGRRYTIIFLVTQYTRNLVPLHICKEKWIGQCIISLWRKL